MKKVSIVGFGRFGKTLYRLIKDDFEVTVYTRNDIKLAGVVLSANTNTTKNISDIYKSEVIFYAVPISEFEEVISSHKKYFKDGQLLIDLLAVKILPAKIFEKYLKNSKIQVLLTHPMFGPDSAKNGFKGLSIILDKFKTDEATYSFWKNYFKSKNLLVVELSAEKHDRLGANSLGLTHFLGRLLEEFHMKPTKIDPVGAKKLLEIKEQVCNDTWQMFTDLQHYNPYTKDMRIKLGDAYDKLYNKLLPKQVDPNFITIGIQGGKGSFNEEAVFYYLKREGIEDYKIKYLYTSENVLSALHKGEIDRAQFAIHNSLGGIVMESVEAMARYKFKIVSHFAIIISHALMIRKDVNFGDVSTIMSHPQVFAQCKHTLLEKYPHLKQTSGEDELIDHAIVAKYLSEGKLQKNIATMGSKILAEIYNLKVVEDNLQDAKENYTSFMQVVRE